MELNRKNTAEALKKDNGFILEHGDLRAAVLEKVIPVAVEDYFDFLYDNQNHPFIDTYTPLRKNDYLHLVDADALSAALKDDAAHARHREDMDTLSTVSDREVIREDVAMAASSAIERMILGFFLPGVEPGEDYDVDDVLYLWKSGVLSRR